MSSIWKVRRVLRAMRRIHRRQLERKAAELGYVELGGEQ